MPVHEPCWGWSWAAIRIGRPSGDAMTRDSGGHAARGLGRRRAGLRRPTGEAHARVDEERPDPAPDDAGAGDGAAGRGEALVRCRCSKVVDPRPDDQLVDVDVARHGSEALLAERL